jgi:hypothetical protein
VLQLCAAPFHFPAREVLVAGVDGFHEVARTSQVKKSASLEAKILVLRHQLNVLSRKSRRIE